MNYKSQILCGLSGGLLGMVLSISGMGFFTWNFWAAMGCALLMMVASHVEN
jgi:hypothetical protein